MSEGQLVLLDIWHNILWSKYKGAVFSALSDRARQAGFSARFFQIAETEGDRVGLSAVDSSYHRYAYDLLYRGSYGQVGTARLVARLFREVLGSDARMVILPGYHRPEYWAQLAAAILTGKVRAVFCDSTANDNPHSGWKAALKRAFFARCHAFFCYGERSREFLCQHGVPMERIFIRCQAAALPHDYDAEAALEARIAQAAPSSAPRFLYVGRLAPEKSLDVLIDAFAAVRAERPGSRLVLVGSGPEGDSLVAKAGRLGLGDSVVFAGGMGPDELREEYLRATCLVLPSRSEPWGLVVNEALSYGCPAVVSLSCGCIPELVLDGETGYRFRTDDRADLARALHAACESFRDVERTAANCLALIGSFNPDRAAAEILQGCAVTLERFGTGALRSEASASPARGKM